ncbi:hypothetical protein H671_2g7647 [Cricetulus griseus]|nr:hypothetical protein H671_2g7647 [Cricetulus griseus]
MVLESIAQSPRSRARTTNYAINLVMNLVVLSLPVVLAACRCQPTHLPVLVDWFGDPLSVRVPSESFKEWPNEDNVKDFICRIFTYSARIQNSQTPLLGPALSSARD